MLPLALPSRSWHSAWQARSLLKAAVVTGSAVAERSVSLSRSVRSGIVCVGAGGATAAIALAFSTGLWPYSKFGFNAHWRHWP